VRLEVYYHLEVLDGDNTYIVMRQKRSMKISDSFDTISERIEKFNTWKDNSPKYWSKGIPLNPNDNVCIVKGVGQEDGSTNKEWMYTHNLVTTVGDEYYAKKITLKSTAGSAYADTNFASDGILFHHDGSSTVTSSTVYGCMVLRNGSATPAQAHDYSDVTGSLDASSSSGNNTTKVLRTNYPRHNDNDSDNTGGANDQVTWSYEWATGDFNTTGITDLSGGCIVDRATAATAGVNAKLLTTFNFASAFEKTASDTLKIFVNHTFEGAG